MAAHGSGAVALSQSRRATVLNIDVGGGTSKLSSIRDGAVLQTAAVNVGARLLAFDESGRVVRVEEPARVLMARLGGTVELGDRVGPERAEAFAALMAEVLFEVARGGPYSELTRELLITEPLSDVPRLGEVDHVMFSGGVSEYVYGRDRTSYGDLGELFGRSIRERIAGLGRPELLDEPAEGIRATVIGAGEYTVQVSGTTSYVSDASVLPVFGLKVVSPALEDGWSVEEAVKRALGRFDLERYTPGLALALSLGKVPDYQSLRRLAEGIRAVVREGELDGEPLFVILDLDVAKSLGGILKEELQLEREIVAIDGIDVGDLDYVDIGRPMGVLEPLPVTVKSLLFPSESGAG
jgi:ethanolamine utilization protein EutA